MELEELKEKKQKLEIERAVLEKEKSQKEENLTVLRKEIEDSFGTSDPEKLMKIKADLEKQIEEKTEEYNELSLND